MKTLRIYISIILLALLAPLYSQNENHKERTYTYQERELEYLMKIWPGEYDNVEQIDFDGYLKKDTSEKGKHERVHNFTKKIALPNFGAHVLYVEEYQNDMPSNITRQSIYSLAADEDVKAIRIKIYHFKNPKPQLSVENMLSFLTNLSPTSPLLNKGCDLLMQREGMAFRGKTEQKDCISSTNPNTTLDYQITVGENDYTFKEIRYDKATGKCLQDSEQLSAYLLEKSRCFICMIDFPNATNGRPTITKYYIPIHDQGGKFEFDYEDGRHMVLGMRNTWSLGMQRETFVIFIQEDSQKGKTLIYSWGNPGADRIGFNPGWIRIQCDLDTPENRKLQHALRPGS